jgi:mono/diheme cytochrome c family protein
MIRYFKFLMAFLAVLLAVVLIGFAGSLYFGSCKYRNTCLDSVRNRLVHTPIPTLAPSTLEENGLSFPNISTTENCTASAEVLLSSWVMAGYPESQPFIFVDNGNVSCQAVFADILPLFTEPNLWYQGALACNSCHNSDLSPASSAQLDLSNYAGIIAGSKRISPNAQGQDILGGGNWSGSKLNLVLFVLQEMPLGHTANLVTPSGPVFTVGLPVAIANITPTATSEAVEVARPDNSGGPGEAVYLTGDVQAGAKIYVDNCQLCHGKDGTGNVPNPGTEDGTVPPLHPIDSTLKDLNRHIYALNIDLFIQNGSHPQGLNPARNMPAWGVQEALTQQQIADVIAYVISLNP